jgi:hypothetical protein
MTLKEFYKLLSSHDWYFEYSDDMSVQRKGEESLRNIRDSIKTNEQQALYDGFQAHYFNGPPWNNDQCPLPEEPSDSGVSGEDVRKWFGA